MPDFMENSDTHAVIKEKLRRNFDGKIVRKDPGICPGILVGTVL